ncbi:hypothetical protein TrLO_g15615 [Triparma laevis f. longispina]|uniref:Kinesin motor domain-containing protein n=1 Tax=Triparma laevis f. longispina TaxID=1714387 RepID=A0A9W7KYK2_9STRA|nr:hypothetical protein TrLO_g15615 [Triparma laevis f. longispina]
MNQESLSYDNYLEEVLQTSRADAMLDGSSPIVSPQSSKGKRNKIKKLAGVFAGGGKVNKGETTSSPTSSPEADDRAREIAELLSYKRRGVGGAEGGSSGGRDPNRVSTKSAMSPNRKKELEDLQRKAGVQEKRKVVEDRVEQVMEEQEKEEGVLNLLEQRRRLSQERAEMAKKIKAVGQQAQQQQHQVFESSVGSMASMASMGSAESGASIYSGVSLGSGGSGGSKQQLRPNGCVSETQEGGLRVIDPRNKLTAKIFQFDQTFTEEDGQEEVFGNVGYPMVEHLLQNGGSSSLVSCGESGSAFTLFGAPQSENESDLGIVPRLCIHLLANLDVQGGDKMTLSFVRVEGGGGLVDLMKEGEEDSELRLREHPDLGTMVENLTEVVIGDPRDIQYYIELAELAAEEEEMKADFVPSFNLFIVKVKREGQSSRIQVLDMGSCESESVEKRKGISALAMTIREMTGDGRKGRQLHSYRDHVLTRVMKEGLVSEGAKCIVVANLSPSSSVYDSTLMTLGYLERLLPAKVMKKIMLAREKMEAEGGAFSPDEKKALVEEMGGGEMLKQVVSDPRQRVARLLEEEEEEEEEEETVMDGDSIDEMINGGGGAPPFSPESPNAAVMADNVLLSSALEEVESLKEQLEKSDEELLDLGGKNEQLLVEVGKGKRDLAATMKMVEEFKAKLAGKEGDIGVMKDDMEEAQKVISALKSKLRVSESEVEALKVEVSVSLENQKLAEASKAEMEGMLGNIRGEINEKSEAMTEIKLLKERVEMLETEKGGLLKSIEQLKIVSEGHRSQAVSSLRMLSQRQESLKYETEFGKLGRIVGEGGVNTNTNMNRLKFDSDLEITLETERGLRMKSEEVSALVAARARASAAEHENIMAKMKIEVEEERGLRMKAEEVSYLVASRAEERTVALEKEVRELRSMVKTEKEMGVSWVEERERLKESIQNKDIALSVLGGELGNMKEASDKEVESLWGVVNKLDTIEGEKDTKISELRSERDQARQELARFIRETGGQRKELSEWKDKAKHFQKVAVTMKAAASKTRAEASKYRKELIEIDKQLLEVAKNEGIDIVDIKVKGGLGLRGLGGGGNNEENKNEFV